MEEYEFEPFTPPHLLGPMDRDYFAYAFELANSAGNLTMPVENPEQCDVTLVDEESDELTLVQFTDHPINRAMLALKNNCEGDSEKFYNLSMRFFAMFPVMRSEEVKKWMTQDKDRPDCILLHPAVVYAGAEVALDKEGEFNIEEFFERVARIATELDEDS